MCGKFNEVLWEIVPEVQLVAMVVHMSWRSLDDLIQISLNELGLVKRGKFKERKYIKRT
jgi:hypothetical protein